MNVLLASAEFLPYHGGVAEVVHGFAQALPDHDIHTTVLTRREFTLKMSGLVSYDLTSYRRPRRPDPRWEIASAALALARNVPSFDITLALDSVFQRALSIMVPRATFIPRAGLYLHGSEVLEHGLIGKTKRRRRLFWACPTLLANSLYTSRLIRGLFARTDVEVIYPGIREAVFAAPRDDERIERLKQSTGQRPLIVTLGRLDPRKGQDTAVEAANLLRHRGFEPAFVFVGGGPLHQELVRRVDELRLGETVHFAGSVSEADKLAWLDAADLVLQPCRRHGRTVEGLGLAMAEAGARGKAVLSSTHGGVPEVVRDGETGVLIPEDSFPEDWANAIESLMRDDGRRSRLGEAARRFVKGTFRWEIAGEKLSELLRSRAERGGKKP